MPNPDKIYLGEATQQDVYQEMKPIVSSFLKGINGFKVFRIFFEFTLFIFVLFSFKRYYNGIWTGFYIFFYIFFIFFPPKI